MANFFKKRGGGPVATSSIQIMSDVSGWGNGSLVKTVVIVTAVHFQSEAALAQSDFNIEKITEIQNKFTGGMVSALVTSNALIDVGGLWYQFTIATFCDHALPHIKYIWLSGEHCAPAENYRAFQINLASCCYILS